MRTRRLTYVWQYALLGLYAAFIGAPLFWLFSIAFKSPQELLAVSPTWLPKAPTLENFRTAIDEQPILRATGISVLVSGASAVLTVVLATPAGYLMARYRGALANVSIGWILVSQMFPFILILIPLFQTVIQIGLYNSLLGLILVYTVWNLPFAMWMLRNFIQEIPRELEQQAMIDGAGRIATLRYVIMPLAAPGLVTAYIFSFIAAWNEFFFALVLIRDQNWSPLSLLLVRFIGVNDIRSGPLAAACLLATIPSLILFALIQRRLTSGLISGAISG